MKNNGNQIENILDYCRRKDLIGIYDVIPCRNRLLYLLGTDFIPSKSEEGKYHLIMGDILDFCQREGIIEKGIANRDLMEARIMGDLMPGHQQCVDKFNLLYDSSPKEATDYLYNMSQTCGYIQVERLSKNLSWKAATEYGPLEITINLSKPEKDPAEIAAAAKAPKTGYPKCLLCKENAGFAGNMSHPARQNLRIVPVELCGQEWFFQYSPYLYYNEHCIVLSPEHTPMKIDKNTFQRLFKFVEKFPHYFIGSNADLPIVGGSILSHDHFQGGRHVFPMEKAGATQRYRHKAFKGVEISRIKWPMPVIRMSGEDRGRLVELTCHVFESWKDYSDLEAGVIAKTKVSHNTATPIARTNREGMPEIDIVLRNNRTSEEYPYGIFHPHEELHHIKKENIGLIEVMGLAILPGRLSEELKAVARLLTGEDVYKPEEIAIQGHPLYHHGKWIESLIQGGHVSRDKAKKILEAAVGIKFKEVLEAAGVFKDNKEGNKHFERFMDYCGFELLYKD